MAVGCGSSTRSVGLGRAYVGAFAKCVCVCAVAKNGTPSEGIGSRSDRRGVGVYLC